MARKLKRQEDDIDWDAVFSDFHSLVEDLNKFFPYKVVKTDGAEADDIIATLTKLNRSGEKTVIVSSDKVYLSLTNGKIVIVNINNGTLEKIFKADNSTILRPIVDNKKMYIISKNSIK